SRDWSSDVCSSDLDSFNCGPPPPVTRQGAQGFFGSDVPKRLRYFKKRSMTGPPRQNDLSTKKSAEGKNVRYPAAAAGAACGESVLRVFAGAAPHLVGRVFFSVDLHLAGHGLANVDVQAVRQTNQVDQHVGDLVGDRLTSFPG